MDLIKAQLERIQRQLSGLSASQKMLTGTLVAIMVMTLLWWGHYAGEPEMEALTTQSASTDELAKARSVLEDRNIKVTLAGDRLMVPAEDKLKAYSVLTYENALPRGVKDPFEDIFKSMNPFQSQDSADKMWMRGKEVLVAQIVREFPHVSNANAIFTPGGGPRIVGTIDPSATITISTDGRAGAAAQKLVDAATALAQGALAGVKPANIHVIVDGSTRKAHNADSPDPDLKEQQAYVQSEEDRYNQKVRQALAFIPNVIVTVTTRLDPSSSDEDRVEFLPKDTVSKERRIRTKTDETSTPTPTATEPGAMPNTSLSIGPNSGPAPAATDTKEDSETELENHVGSRNVRKHNPTGMPMPVAAAIHVPLSYYESAYRRKNPGFKGDLTEKMLQPVIDSEKPTIVDSVVGATFLTQDKIFVDPYPDAEPTLIGAPAPTLAASPMRYLTPRHVKEAALGVLALISLFMVSSLVKKGTPVVAAAPAPLLPSGPNVLNASEPLAGEVAAADPSLDAMELDDEAIRAQQMIEQVATLVKENPDSAAALVKRWLNRA